MKLASSSSDLTDVYKVGNLYTFLAITPVEYLTKSVRIALVRDAHVHDSNTKFGTQYRTAIRQFLLRTVEEAEYIGDRVGCLLFEIRLF